MSEALRDNKGKAELAQLLHFLPALEELAAHCTAGREKYPDSDGLPNWLQAGKPDEEYLDAAMRHLSAIVRDGEDYDDELGTTHAAAVIWNMMVYVTCNYPTRAKTDPSTFSPDIITYGGVVGYVEVNVDALPARTTRGLDGYSKALALGGEWLVPISGTGTVLYASSQGFFARHAE